MTTQLIQRSTPSAAGRSACETLMTHHWGGVCRVCREHWTCALVPLLGVDPERRVFDRLVGTGAAFAAWRPRCDVKCSTGNGLVSS